MLATLKDFDFRNKKVLIRVDYNVPLKKGRVADNSRIKESLRTINFLIKKDCKIILMSHLGRPEGKIVNELRMDPVARTLSKLLKKKVKKLDDCVGEKVKREIEKMKNREVILLENLRFHAEEEKNNKNFSKKLAELAEVYVNDAFGAAHRTHASTVGVTKFLSSCAGFLLERELKILNKVIKKPERPFIAILGGAKVSDKIGVITNLIKLADYVFVGGAMMFTFYKANGYSVGKSIVDDSSIKLAKELLKNEKLLLPVDCVVAKNEKSAAKLVNIKDIPDNYTGFDVGEKSVEALKQLIKNSGLVIWNGPLGKVEVKRFAKGTEEIANYLASSDAFSLVGGGDTLAVINRLKLSKYFDHVSTGGGAMLEFLEGKKLPGVVALQK